MKQISNPKRVRNHRGNGRRPNHHGHGHGHGRGSTFESSGPEGKIRGTAQQVIERYQALGRDAMTAGDRIGAENFFQHAEHYYRVSSANGAGHRSGRERPPEPAVADSSGDAATKSNGAGAVTDSEQAQA